MRTTVVDVRAKLMVTNGVIHVVLSDGAFISVHAWLKRHMDEFPASQYEYVIGDKIALDLNAGEYSRPTMTADIIALFDQHRMNFGEELRLRLITKTPFTSSSNTDTSSTIASAPSHLPPLEEVFKATRLTPSELEEILENSSAHDAWLVVVAYCELKRRGRTISQTGLNNFNNYSKSLGFTDSDKLIFDILSKFSHKDYPSFLTAINKVNNKANAEESIPYSNSDIKKNTSTRKKWYNSIYIKIAIIIFSISFIVQIYSRPSACDCANILDDRSKESDELMEKAYNSDGNFNPRNEYWAERARECMKHYTSLKKWEIEAVQGMGTLITSEALENASMKCAYERTYSSSQMSIACECWNQSYTKTGRAYDNMSSAEQKFRDKCFSEIGDEYSMKAACEFKSGSVTNKSVSTNTTSPPSGTNTTTAIREAPENPATPFVGLPVRFDG